MKKILLSLMIMGASVFGADAVHFKFNNKMAGGFVGDKAVFVYQDNEAAEFTQEAKLKILAQVAKDSVCKDKDASLLLKSGIEVVYVYPSTTGVTIVTIDNCDDK